jgi:hypothetical protein
MGDLIGGPEEFHAFAPRWEPVFWDLAEQETEALLASAGEWLAALAVVRAERTEAEAFREVFATVLRRLEGMSETERMRWYDLLWFVLSWALRRWPGQERTALFAAAPACQTEVEHQREVQPMSETIERTWEQEIFARGEVHGEARGQLLECRENLQVVLEARFGPIPEALAQQIESIDDLERLRAAFRQALRLDSLSDLKL